jgi:hypothetical protein
VKKIGFLCFLAVALMMFSGFAGLVTPSGQDEKSATMVNDTKVDIPPQIMKKINEEIGRTNPMFIAMIKLLPSMNEEELELFKPIVKNAFCMTYLKNPRFTKEGRNTIEGWDNILPVLKELAAKRTTKDIPITGVEISAKYLAYDLEVRPPLEKDVDLFITIKTHLNLGSTSTGEGDMRHRRLCDLY